MKDIGFFDLNLFTNYNEGKVVSVEKKYILSKYYTIY